MSPSRGRPSTKTLDILDAGLRQGPAPDPQMSGTDAHRIRPGHVASRQDGAGLRGGWGRRRRDRPRGARSRSDGAGGSSTTTSAISRRVPLGSSRPIRSGEFVDLAIRALPDPLIIGIEMVCQVRVMFEPPGCRTGDDEETASSGPERLQMGDGLAAFRGVMASIVTPIVLREMPRFVPFDVEQVGISLADHDDPGGRWEETAHVGSDPSNHPQVIDRSAQARDHGLDFVLPCGQPISNLESRPRDPSRIHLRTRPQSPI